MGITSIPRLREGRLYSFSVKEERKDGFPPAREWQVMVAGDARTAPMGRLWVKV